VTKASDEKPTLFHSFFFFKPKATQSNENHRTPQVFAR
jgi:hypothetical protein